MALVVVVLAAGVVVPLVLANDEPDARSPTPDSSESASGRPSQEWDLAGVSEALRQIDPCRLLSLEVARKRKRPRAVTIPTRPHSCVLVASPDATPDDPGLTVRVGVESDQSTRYSGKPIVIGGAKVYQYASRDRWVSTCRIVIPVGYVRAIELFYELYDDVALCSTVRQYAQATVARLRNPDTIAFRDTTRPFSAWDSCVLLATALGDTALDYRFFPGDSDLSGCQTTNPTTDPTTANDSGATPSIDISYDEKTDPSGDSRIAGRAVEITRFSNGQSCSARWVHGPSGTHNPWYATTIVDLDGLDCDTVIDTVRTVMTLVNRQSNTSDITPQRPLVFAPDENDTDSPGACVNLGVPRSQHSCEPYQPVPVPPDPTGILSAATTNQHVQCAVFQDAVHAVFGEQFAPVVWAAHCFFVDDTHMIAIQVNVATGLGTAPAGYVRIPDLYADINNTTMGGLAAITFWNTGRKSFDIYVSPHNNINHRDNLHIDVTMIGGRGHELRPSRTLPQVDAARATRAMTQVVNKWFQ